MNLTRVKKKKITKTKSSSGIIEYSDSTQDSNGNDIFSYK